MAKQSRIKTPLLQRWNHFRIGILPFLFFFVTVVMTVFLWERQTSRGSVVGEVEAIRTDVAVGSEGILRPLGVGTYWKLFDEVSAGEPIAILDDQLLKAQYREAQAEIERLGAELTQTKAQLAVDLQRIQQQYTRDKYQRIVDAETAHLRVLDLGVQIAADRKSLTQRDTRIKYFVKQQAMSKGNRQRRKSDDFSPITTSELVDRLVEATGEEREKLAAIFRKPMSGSFAERDLVDELNQRDIIREQIDKNTYTLKRQQQIYERAKERRRPFLADEMQLPEIDAMIAGFREAAEAQQARLERIEVQIDNLIVKAPMDGIITKVWAFPGQNVQPGDPVITIAQKSSDYIVSYWRESQKTRPSKDLQVGIRLAQPGGEEYPSKIAIIGPQVEPIPDHQLKTAGTPEYGIPIKLLKPPGLELRPGELVHVFYRRSPE